ncbi:MAG TPA: hypothetical protein VMF88_05270 [Bacteroidota bacterium]|nr:hypothetical protein [Bacteroidota bacterium]
MGDWNDEIEIELRRARQSKNPGRLRTSARRAAGIAIREFQKLNAPHSAEQDYLSALRTFMKLERIPPDVASAAARLEARLGPDFTSPSVDPIGDAMIIVEFVRIKLRDSGR